MGSNGNMMKFNGYTILARPREQPESGTWQDGFEISLADGRRGFTWIYDRQGSFATREEAIASAFGRGRDVILYRRDELL